MLLALYPQSPAAADLPTVADVPAPEAKEAAAPAVSVESHTSSKVPATPKLQDIPSTQDLADPPPSEAEAPVRLDPATQDRADVRIESSRPHKSVNAGQAVTPSAPGVDEPPPTLPVQPQE